jgi:O-antigen ligase
MLGFGWGTFPSVSPSYYHVARGYPLSAVAEAHSVILSNAAELGAVGLVIWFIVLALAVIAPLLRRGPPEAEAWKLGLMAIAVAWFVQANFAPLSYAFDNYIVWLFAGIAGALSVTARVSDAGTVVARSAARLTIAGAA